MYPCQRLDREQFFLWREEWSWDKENQETEKRCGDKQQTIPRKHFADGFHRSGSSGATGKAEPRGLGRDHR